MTNLPSKHSYNLGDTFGESLQTDQASAHAQGEGSWCNQADGTFEQDDAVRQQGGAA